MVDENEVNRWIARLETEESSWTNYERLAVLYAIRDQQSGSRESFDNGILRSARAG